MTTKNKSFRKRYEDDVEEDENGELDFKERRVKTRNWKKWYEEHEDDYDEVMEFPKLKR
jgi:hypothetical protein